MEGFLPCLEEASCHFVSLAVALRWWLWLHGRYRQLCADPQGISRDRVSLCVTENQLDAQTFLISHWKNRKVSKCFLNNVQLCSVTVTCVIFQAFPLKISCEGTWTTGSWFQIWALRRSAGPIARSCGVAPQLQHGCAWKWCQISPNNDEHFKWYKYGKTMGKR